MLGTISAFACRHRELIDNGGKLHKVVFISRVKHAAELKGAFVVVGLLQHVAPLP
jgi:hypothetical protein